MWYIDEKKWQGRAGVVTGPYKRGEPSYNPCHSEQSEESVPPKGITDPSTPCLAALRSG